MSLHVARLQPGAASATVVVDHSWTIANGSLRGTVYYWSNNLGRVLRIKPGAAAPEDFLAARSAGQLQHLPRGLGQRLDAGDRRRHGRRRRSICSRNTPVLNLGSVGKPMRNWAMPALSPNGKVLIENNAPLPGPPGGSDGMFDTSDRREDRRHRARRRLPRHARLRARRDEDRLRRSQHAWARRLRLRRRRSTMATNPIGLVPRRRRLEPQRDRFPQRLARREVDRLSPRPVPELARHALRPGQPVPRERRSAGRRDSALGGERRHLPVRRRRLAIATTTTSRPSRRSTRAATCGSCSRAAARTATG